jgi:hypothetical protein
LAPNIYRLHFAPETGLLIIVIIISLYFSPERQYNIRNMAYIVVACEMLRDELEQALRETGADYPVFWVDSGLHNSPDKLREHLQKILASMTEPLTVLMTFGKCGNSVVGLHTGAHSVVLPRADDCISMLLGSPKRRVEIAAEGGMYFLTRGWLRGKRSIWGEYQYAAEKYGERRAKTIMAMIFKNYRYIATLNTGSYAVETIAPEATAIAEAFSLEYKEIPGTIAYLKDLLTGPWADDRFVTFAPHSVVTDFRL